MVFSSAGYFSTIYVLKKRFFQTVSHQVLYQLPMTNFFSKVFSTETYKKVSKNLSQFSGVCGASGEGAIDEN